MSPADVTKTELAHRFSSNHNYGNNIPTAISKPLRAQTIKNSRYQVKYEDNEGKRMKFDLELVDLKTGVATLQLLQSLHNFVNPYNCYDCAKNVENSPKLVTNQIDYIKFVFIPVR